MGLRHRVWLQVLCPKPPTTHFGTVTVAEYIGLTFKIRARTMRGFKAMDKVLGHPYLASFLGPEDGLCDLRKVI